MHILSQQPGEVEYFHPPVRCELCFEHSVTEVQQSSVKHLRSKSSKILTSREPVNTGGWEGPLARILIWGEVMAQYANNRHASLRTWVQCLEFMLIKKKKKPQAWWPPYRVYTVSSCQGEILPQKARDGLLRNKTMVYSGIHRNLHACTEAHTSTHSHAHKRTHIHTSLYQKH